MICLQCGSECDFNVLFYWRTEFSTVYRISRVMQTNSHMNMTHKCMSVTTIKSSSRICHAISGLCFSVALQLLVLLFSRWFFFVRNIPPWKRLLTFPHIHSLLSICCGCLHQELVFVSIFRHIYVGEEKREPKTSSIVSKLWIWRTFECNLE